MNAIQEALAPVMRDVSATTDVRLSVDEGGWSTDLGPSALVAGTGVYVRLENSESERVIAAAEAVQGIVIDELAARASNWPMCPAHRSSHPMEAQLVAEQAWWVCPADHVPVARIGSLKL